MAASTTRTIPGAPQAPPPPKPKKNRSTQETEKSQKLAKELESAEDFWIYLTQFEADAWQYLIAYLWRVEPITDRRTGGKPSSICKYTRPFDVDQIMKQHGSGIYRIDLCHISPTGNKHERIRQAYFKIENMDYPPRVPFGDWLNDPGNQQWKWAENALRRRDSGQGEGAQPAAPTPDASEIFRTVLQGVQTLRGEKDDNATLANTVMQMLNDNQARMFEQNDPMKQLATLRQLLESITPKEDSGMKLIVEMLREELKETRSELRQIRETQAKPRTFLEEVELLIPAAEKLRTLVGGGKAASTGTDWGAVIAGTIDKLSEHVPLLIQMAQSKTPPPAAPTGWPPLTPGATRAPQPARPPAAPGDQTAQTEPGEPNGQSAADIEARMREILATHGPIIQATAPFLVDMYRRQLTGYDLRDWFISGYGMLKWSQLKSEVGAETLTAIAQLNPVLKVQLAPPEKLLAFLNEFFTDVGSEQDVTTDDGKRDQEDDRNEGDTAA